MLKQWVISCMKKVLLEWYDEFLIILEQFWKILGPHTVSDQKKIPFWNYFFHFLPSKTCNSGVAMLKCYWLIGMKIMKFIHHYWTQWCETFISWVLLAPSSVEIFNFWTRRDWRLKFSQIDVLMFTAQKSYTYQNICHQ